MRQTDPQAPIRAAIRSRRLMLGLRQGELAIALRMTRLTYLRFENGPRRIHVTEIETLCQLFGCSVRELLSCEPSAHAVVQFVEARGGGDAP